MEDTLRLPGEGELTENFLLEDLREVPLEILAEVRLILPDVELPLDGEHALEPSRDAELEVELSREEELTENSLVEDGLEKAVRRSPKLEREFRLNPSVETDLETAVDGDLIPVKFFFLEPPVFLDPSL